MPHLFVSQKTKVFETVCQFCLKHLLCEFITSIPKTLSGFREGSKNPTQARIPTRQRCAPCGSSHHRGTGFCSPGQPNRRD